MATDFNSTGIEIGGKFTTAKAFCSFNGTGSISINDDYGVSSLADNATGNYDINLDASTNSDDSCVSSGGYNAGTTTSSSGYTTRCIKTDGTIVHFYCLNVNEGESTSLDFYKCQMICFGDPHA